MQSKFLLAKSIVKKFIIKEQINYNRDIKCAYKLIRLFPSEDFWIWFGCEPTFSAMPQLLTAKSIEFITNQYNLFKLKIKIEKPPELKDSIEIESVQKPHTLKDFLQIK